MVPVLCVAIGIFVTSCMPAAATSRLRDTGDAKLNPKDIGLSLSKDEPTRLQIGVPKTLSGAASLCEAKDRIEDCSKALAVPAVAKTPAADRLIFATETLDLAKNGNFFAVALGGTVVLRFKLSDKQAVPTPSQPPTTPSQGNGVGTALTIATFAALNTDSSAPAGTMLQDIVTHIPTEQIATYKDSNMMTWGHETTHGINAHIRNNLSPQKTGMNGFYLLKGQYALVKEPGIRKSAVAVYVPANLRGSRFDLYVAGQQAWDDRPLYIFDEWTAYINGGTVAVELANKSLWKDGNLDGVRGIIEFNVYALATAMAIKAGDATYYKDYTQFREFVAYNMRRGMATYNEGVKMTFFSGFQQDEYMANLRTSPEAEAMRSFAKEFLGADYCKEVLGF